MKKIIIVIVVIAVVLGVFLFWFARNAIILVTKGPGITVKTAAVPDEASHSIRVLMTLTGTQKPHSITEISMPRDLAQSLSVSAPKGFTEQLLPLDERSKSDAESIKFVKEYNRDKLRWVGSFPS